MAEELRLDELLGNGGAVDLDELLLGPQAVGVDGPGDELLARAALALDEDGRVGRGDLEDLPPELPHQGMAADELIALLGPLLEVLVFPSKDVLLEGVADGEKDPLPVEGLLQEIEGAELGCLDRGLDRPLARDHDDLRGDGFLLDLGQELEAVLARQLDIEEDEVEADCQPELLEAVLACRRLEEFVALVLEDHLEGLADALLVVDDEDAGGTFGLHGPSFATPAILAHSTAPGKATPKIGTVPLCP
ncbi:MAG TPA: hypothetical protein VMS75_12490 [Terriglobales bacterium]|nr:hypothetical protein [Terriglobales bacterium]